MKIGDSVIHIDYPKESGLIVAKTKNWPGKLPVFLVKWDNGLQISRHIEQALKVVAK